MTFMNVCRLCVYIEGVHRNLIIIKTKNFICMCMSDCRIRVVAGIINNSELTPKEAGVNNIPTHSTHAVLDISRNGIHF